MRQNPEIQHQAPVLHVFQIQRHARFKGRFVRAMTCQSPVMPGFTPSRL
jgi:hypothetical protein